MPVLRWTAPRREGQQPFFDMGKSQSPVRAPAVTRAAAALL